MPRGDRGDRGGVSNCQTRFRKPKGIAQKDREFCEIVAQNMEPVLYTFVSS